MRLCRLSNQIENLVPLGSAFPHHHFIPWFAMSDTTNARFGTVPRGKPCDVRLVVVGATGDVGTSLISALECDPEVTSIVGVARREPSWRPAKVEWRTGDVRTADLVPMFSGADAVVHLAWIFFPTDDPAATWQTNVIGSTR